MNGDANAISTTPDARAAPHAQQNAVSVDGPVITADATVMLRSAASAEVQNAEDLSYSRILGLRLLDAALSRDDYVSEPAIIDRAPITPSPALGLPPSNLSIKDMIKLKLLPIDFAVDVARLAMGRGTEDDEFLYAPTSETDGVVRMGIEMDLDRIGDVQVGGPLDSEISLPTADGQ